jgi:hypothetical protein
MLSLYAHLKPPDNSLVFWAGTAQSVQRRAGRPGFDSRQRQDIFLFFSVSRQTPEWTQPSIQWVPGALSQEVKRPGHENDYSPPLSAEVRNGGATSPLPTYIFMAWSLINYAHRQHCFFFTSNISAVTLRILNVEASYPEGNAITANCEFKKSSHKRNQRLLCLPRDHRTSVTNLQVTRRCYKAKMDGIRCTVKQHLM